METQGLHNLVAAEGSRKKPKRVGRGESSGLGKTSGRGHKGQKARKSGGVRPGFEGGQIPLARRLPKRGFTNIFRQNWTTINLERISKFFEDGGEIEKADLIEKGLVKKPSWPVKILGGGEINGAYTFKVDAVTAGARQKIEAAGGKIVLNGQES